MKSSGFDEKQAEAVVETIDTAVNETVATKADLAVLAAELGGVKKTVGDIQDNIDKNMATKTDLALLAAKMATKDELRALADKMATKDDLNALVDKMATKDELKALAKTVKAEIASLETRMLRMMLLQTLVLVSTFGALIFTAVKLL